MPGSILFRDKLDPETAIFSDVQEVPRYIYIYTYPDIYIYIPLYIYIYPETAIFSDVQEVGPPSPLQTRISSERLDRFRSSSVLSLGWGCCEYWCFRWGGAAANISALVGVGLLIFTAMQERVDRARDILNGLPEHGCSVVGAAVAVRYGTPRRRRCLRSPRAAAALQRCIITLPGLRRD